MAYGELRTRMESKGTSMSWDVIALQWGAKMLEVVNR